MKSASQRHLSALKEEQVKTFTWIFIVALAGWNSVLRPAQDVPITPYYLLAPGILLYVVVKAEWASKWVFAFFVFCSYGLFVGISFGVPITMQGMQLLKYAQLLTFFLMLKWIWHLSPHNEVRLVRTVITLCAMAFFIAFLQQITGFEFRTVVNFESHIWLNTFFFTPNDLALFLSGVFCLIVLGPYRPSLKFVFGVLILVLNARNDAKAATIACVMMVLAFFAFHALIKAKIRPIFAVALLPFAFYLCFALLDFLTEIGITDIDSGFLIFDPLKRVINLEPSGLGGSIYDRTDALIFSLEAFYSSHFLGLGPGGSVYNLSYWNRTLLTAKSLHNALIEIFIEFGPMALILFFIVLKPVMKALLNKSATSDETRLLCFGAAAPLLAVSMSSGFISNYAFWLTGFLIWYPVAVQQLSPRNGPRIGF